MPPCKLWIGREWFVTKSVTCETHQRLISAVHHLTESIGATLERGHRREMITSQVWKERSALAL